MGKVATKEVLRGHRAIALDTCVWIYHLELNADHFNTTTSILKAVASGQCHAFISELTLMELVVGPLKLARQDVADEYETLLSHYPNLTIVQITRPILLGAANLRANHGFRTPDAIVLATAILSGAELVISNDRQWSRIGEIKVVCLDEMVG